MRLVFAGESFAPFRTLQRLLLIAEEIGFIDRPSVTFGQWGLIGHASAVRRYRTDDLPVLMKAHESPSSMATGLYESLAERDLGNPSFVRTFAEGFARNDRFASKFIQFDADYSGTKGSDVRAQLVADPTLAGRTYAVPQQLDFGRGVNTAHGRSEIFSMHLVEASVYVTSAMFVAEDTGLLPVADDPYMSRLLAARASEAAYLGESQRITPMLGLAVAQAVVPDAALDHLNVGDILEYRRQASDAYSAWTTEINRLSAIIADTSPEKVEALVASVIATEVAPRLVEYRNEMAATRDKLFGDLIKTVAKWELPSLSLAFVAGLSLSSALALSAAAATPVVPAIVDYFQSRRNANRRYAMSYLIEAAPPA